MTDLEAQSMLDGIRALLWPLDQYANQAFELAANHPVLIPELAAANDHVKEALDAIHRAANFVGTKFTIDHFGEVG